jgi:transcriptional regulator with PAS, ATPase and Fis domain
MDDSSLELRWQSYLRHAGEPLFLLNRRRRLVFANRAWEECVRLSVADARGRPCRAARSTDAERGILPIPVLAPPPEALAGQTCRARRRAPSGDWWLLDFFPIRGAQGLLGILGKITPLPAASPVVASLPDRLAVLRDRLAEAYRLDTLPTEPPPLARMVEQARLASQSRLPVTLIGEAGTGKHWLARAIHQASPQRERAFVRLDARGLPAPVLADWLLTTRPAIGTVYVREPGELPRELQDRLAQQLHADDRDRPRLIVGHRADPIDAVRSGRLLDALHFAASTLTIDLPPLRARLAELEQFVSVFLTRIQRLMESTARHVSVEAAQALRSHRWPGNLRELYDALCSAARRAKGDCIELTDLPFFLRDGPLPAEKKLPLDDLLEQAERRLILLALRQAGGNRTRAAEILGIWRPRLLRRLEHFAIATEEHDQTQ